MLISSILTWGGTLKGVRRSDTVKNGWGFTPTSQSQNSTGHRVYVPQLGPRAMIYFRYRHRHVYASTCSCVGAPPMSGVPRCHRVRAPDAAGLCIWCAGTGGSPYPLLAAAYDGRLRPTAALTAAGCPPTPQETHQGLPHTTQGEQGTLLKSHTPAGLVGGAFHLLYSVFLSGLMSSGDLGKTDIEILIAQRSRLPFH